MKIIGITGPSGAGKGIVGKMLSQHGIPCADTDAIYHKLLTPPSPCLDELVAEFGKGILLPDKTLNRKALAKIVFTGEECKINHETLNRITHKYVLEKVKYWLSDCEENKYFAVAIDAPLLFESGFDKICHTTLGVLANKNARIARVAERDGLGEDAILQRFDSQPQDDYYKSRCDCVIYNDVDKGSLETAVNNFIEKFVKETVF